MLPIRSIPRTLSVLVLVLVLLAGARPAAAGHPYANGDLLWAKSMGGPADDANGGVAVDASGNVYVAGGFQGTADFDPGPGTANLTSAGESDIFVAKFDPGGNLVWAKQMSGIFDEEAYSLTVDSGGDVYTTGTFWGTVDFDPGPGVFNMTYGGVGDIFVSRLDTNGNFVWAKQLGNGSAYAITVDAGGNVYTTGFGNGDFDPGPGTFFLPLIGFNDLFVSKLDSHGDFVWARGIGGTGFDGGWDIAVDGGGNVYTTGAFQGTVDFDPGPGVSSLTSAGDYDAFVLKLDTNGDFVWVKATGGTGPDYGYGLALDASGNIYRSGSFAGAVDFDPGPGVSSLTSAGGGDAFVSKLDTNGSFVWAKGMGGPGHDQAGFVTLDAVGNLYLGGVFRGTVDFDPGAGTYNLTSAGLNDLFAARLNTYGGLAWAKSVGGPDNEFGLTIALDAGGSLYASGSYKGTADFDPGPGTHNLTSAGGEDPFVLKLENSAASTATFADVPVDYWAWSFVERLYAAGITGGCATNPLRYCPEDTVTRAQMAVFLLRGIHTSAYTPPAVGAGTGFGDVPTSYWAAAFIKQLAVEGITSGCGGGNYCPESPVTRAQMAVFLLKAKYGASYVPPAVGTSTGFGDVPPDYWAAAFIKQLVTEGITAGCGSGNYCPEQPVTRAQMAVFLVRTFSLP